MQWLAGCHLVARAGGRGVILPGATLGPSLKLPSVDVFVAGIRRRRRQQRRWRQRRIVLQLRRGRATGQRGVRGRERRDGPPPYRRRSWGGDVDDEIIFVIVAIVSVGRARDGRRGGEGRHDPYR